MSFPDIWGNTICCEESAVSGGGGGGGGGDFVLKTGDTMSGELIMPSASVLSSFSAPSFTDNGSSTEWSSNKRIKLDTGSTITTPTSTSPSYGFNDNATVGLFYQNITPSRLWIQGDTIRLNSNALAVDKIAFNNDQSENIISLATSGTISNLNIESGATIVFLAPLVEALSNMNVDQGLTVGTTLHVGGLTFPNTDSKSGYVVTTNGSGVLSLQPPLGITYPLLAPSGVAAAPSYSFSTSPQSGTYFSGSFANPRITMLTDTSGGAPVCQLNIGYSVSSSLPYEIYLDAPLVRFNALSWLVQTGTYTELSYPLNDNSIAGQVITTDGKGNLSFQTPSGGAVTYPLYATASAQSAPAFSSSSATSSGLYFGGRGTGFVGVAVAGQDAVLFEESGTSTISFFPGTVSSTQYGFYNSPSLASMTSNTSGVITVTAAGSTSAQFNSSGILATNGSLTAPSYSFTSYPTVGMYLTSGQLAFGVLGTQVCKMSLTNGVSFPSTYVYAQEGILSAGYGFLSGTSSVGSSASITSDTSGNMTIVSATTQFTGNCSFPGGITPNTQTQRYGNGSNITITKSGGQQHGRLNSLYNEDFPTRGGTWDSTGTLFTINNSGGWFHVSCFVTFVTAPASGYKMYVNIRSLNSSGKHATGINMIQGTTGVQDSTVSASCTDWFTGADQIFVEVGYTNNSLTTFQLSGLYKATWVSIYQLGDLAPT